MEEKSHHSTTQMLNVIIYGAPGSGKGTQSDLIIQKYNLSHLSTGDLIRKEIADNTELGQFASELIANGQLVPDEIVIKMIANKISEALQNSNGFIFDGFPRTVAQAEALEAMCEEKGIKTDILIDLQVNEAELINRLLERGKISGRSDDNLETIQKRLDVYVNQTKPVTEFYKNRNKHAVIDGMGTIEEIFNRISDTLNAVNS